MAATETLRRVGCRARARDRERATAKHLGFTSFRMYQEYKRMGCFSNKDEYMESRTCLICAEDIPDRNQRVGCANRHNTCLSCAMGAIRNALSDHASYIHAEGIRCVAHPASLGGCSEFLDDSYFRRLHHLSSTPIDDDDDQEGFSSDQLERLQLFVSQANVTAAMPPEALVFCPECSEKFWIDPRADNPADNSNNSHTRRRCPHCRVFICLPCRVQYHHGMTCTEYMEHQRRTSQLMQEAEQTEAYVRATTKPCPSCSVPTSHFHGHSCHHIRPDGGCTNCHTHWCYACGATAEENERDRGLRNRCQCERSSWSSFCRTTNIRDNLIHWPYPYDQRCGCQICPECRPGNSCDACDGTCVVCLGLVPPGPAELPLDEDSETT